jgi:hypothetical protein
MYRLLIVQDLLWAGPVPGKKQTRTVLPERETGKNG